jgi:phospholipid transport system substrate-binding protein
VIDATMRAFVYPLLVLLGAFPSLVSGATSTATAAATPGPGPQELMEQVSRDMQQAIDADREALAKDPAKLRALIDRLLLPHFDTDYAARMVLGLHWRNATESQRKRFIEAFYQSLMKDYGDAMLQFKRDQLKILPFRGDAAANTATVRTEVMREGKVVPVNFSVRRTPDGWKVWDVTIEGISYARNFRNDFGTEVNQQGLEHLIQRLEAQNAGTAPRAPSAAPAAPAPKPAARTG